MKKFTKLMPMLLSTISVMAVPMSPTFAQDETSADSGPVDDESATELNRSVPAGAGLAEIVVTAQRRSESAQKVPIAITAVDAAALEAAAITSTTELNSVAPGLNLRTSGGAFTPYIRGIGTSSNVVESPVALYIDGVYYPQPREGLRQLYDIEQLAILKGPQGTLFGRNATGGVIQITTKKPSFVFGGSAGASIDNYGKIDTNVYLTGPISDTVAFSIAGQYGVQLDGYGTNLTTGRDTYKLENLVSVRGKLYFEPSDRTNFTLIADYMDRRDRNTAYRPFPGTSFSIPGIAPIEGRYDSRESDDAFSYVKGGGISLTAEHDFGFAQLTSISAYRDGKGGLQIFPFPDPAGSFKVTYVDAPSTSYSQELQLSSAPGRFKWVVGAYYFNYRNATQPTKVMFSGPPFNLGGIARIENYGIEKAESIAPFGQVDWEFAEGTILTAGARWTYEKREADRQTALLFVGAPAPVTVVNDQSDITFKEPTYRLVLSHQFTPSILGYVSFNRGFKSGGFNIVNARNPAYLSENLDAYEAGLKSEFLDRRIRLNVASYYYQYENIQTIRYPGGTPIIDNGGAAELYGLEVDISAQVTDEFTLKGSVALAHTEFTDFPEATLFIPQPNGSNLFVTGSAKGNRLPLAQEVSGSLSLDYHHELPSGAIDANVLANYNGDYFFEAGGGSTRQHAYTMINATLKYTFPNEKISVSIFGKNLLNEDILAFPNTQEFGFEANFAPPRTYGGAIRFEF